MSLLELTGLSHSFGDKVLYKNAELHLYAGERMGITGQNGSGKSTLLRILQGNLLPDEGRVVLQPRITLGALDQQATVDRGCTLYDHLRFAFRPLDQADARLQDLYRRMADPSAAANDSLLEEASALQQQLEQQGYYEIDSRICRAAAGLGLDALGLDRPLGELSGGQRAKVILARLLLEAPDLLILDEPTNFLDTDHVNWLARTLSAYPGALILVSHQSDFLDRVATCICDIEFGIITRYHGNYSAFLQQKSEKREAVRRQYENQQRKIHRLEDYIAKNRVRTATASMAKSRQKTLDKMVRVAPPPPAAKPVFRFPYQSQSQLRVLEVDYLSIGYGLPLLPPVSFRLNRGQKLVITGFNGVGKTTLLQTLTGRLKSLGGCFHFSDDAVVGYCEQDAVFADDSLTPLAYLTARFPRMEERALRRALAACGLRAEHVRRSLSSLSGGEQAKARLCCLTLIPANVLILDEPTNHLDREAKEALLESLKTYPGSLILVSHERAFYREIGDRILDVSGSGLRVSE